MNEKKLGNNQQVIRNLAAVLIMVVILLASCQGESFLRTVFPGEATDEVALSQATITPTVNDPEQVDIAPENEQSSTAKQVLRIWVPPQFSPFGETPAAELISEQWLAFEAQNPQIKIEVRVKAVSGKGNLLETLTNASVAAPDTIPALIAFPRMDMETAISRGLLFPISSYSTEIDTSDWYEYAREIALYKNVPYGLPFAGDALVVLADPTTRLQGLDSWEDFRKQAQSLIFPADDPEALLGLHIYLSAQGKLQDQQGHPILQEDILLQVLEVIQLNTSRRVFLNDFSQFQSFDQVWQAFQENPTGTVATWSSNYLPVADDYNIGLLPSLSEQPYILARGWIWCLADNDPRIAEQALKLAEFLVDEEFIAKWSQDIGYLPVRPSSLAAWQENPDLNIISKIVIAAHSRPDNELISQMGPIFRDAIKSVLSQEKTGEAATLAAISQIEAINSK